MYPVQGDLEYNQDEVHKCYHHEKTPRAGHPNYWVVFVGIVPSIQDKLIFW